MLSAEQVGVGIGGLEMLHFVGTPHILKPDPHPLNLKPNVLNPNHHTLNPEPDTPKISTLDRKPETLEHPQP